MALVKKSFGDAITFSRASSSTVIRDGVLYTVGNDVPAIGDDGLQVFGSATNLALWSEELDNAAWTKRAGSTIEANTVEVLDPYGTNLADKHTNTDTTTSSSYIAKASIFATDNTDYCCSVFVKRGSQDTAKLIMYSRLSSTDRAEFLFNFDTLSETVSNIGAVSGATGGFVDAGGGWYRIWLSANMLAGSEVAGFRFIPSSWGLPTSIGAEYGYAFGAQVTTGRVLTPYIKTEGTTVTRSADVVSIPVQNNLPAPGKPFTIAVDAEVPAGQNDSRFLQVTVPASLFYLRRDSAGSAQFRTTSSGTGLNSSATLSSGQIPSGFVRYVARYDGIKKSLFANGVKGTTEDTVTGVINMDYSASLFLNSASFPVNGVVKNFRIYHTALSDEQIAALGGPQ